MRYPWALDYWNSGEWQVVNERLHDLERRKIVVNPKRELLFSPLRALPLGEVKVVLLGQDPYPSPGFATGYAFSIPGTVGPEAFPPTLKLLFKEYCSDLGYESPVSGDLSSWSRQGVLLWNAIPSLQDGRSLSHDWHGGEWDGLTREIIQKLSRRGVCFVLLGSVARRFLSDIDQENNEVILTSHPSPRGAYSKHNPFIGSRLFSTINDKLNTLGLETIDWELKNGDQGQSTSHQDDRRHTGNGMGKILDNITGSSCGPLRDSGGILIRE